MTNRFRVFKIAGWLLALFFVLILIVLPLLTSSLIGVGRLPAGFSKYLTGIEWLQSSTMLLFIVVWIFFIGSCFASFLNVVAWRVPRGRHILGSSKCPYCNVRLKFRDNLPIVGWLCNAGRCRRCRLPISARYLVAEIILGTLFLLIALVELAGGGVNLPFRPDGASIGFEQLLMSPQWELIRLVVYQLVLISTLFTFSLIETEKFSIPIPVVLYPLALGIGLPLIWTDMLLVSWDGRYGAIHLSQFGIDKWLTLILGGGAGLIAGWLIKQASARGNFLAGPQLQHRTDNEESESSIDQEFPKAPQRKPDSHGSGLAVGLMLVGVFLGWQAVGSTVLIFLMLSFVGGFIYKSSLTNSTRSHAATTVWNDSSQLLLATLIHLLSWRIQGILG